MRNYSSCNLVDDPCMIHGKQECALNSFCKWNLETTSCITVPGLCVCVFVCVFFERYIDGEISISFVSSHVVHEELRSIKHNVDWTYQIFTVDICIYPIKFFFVYLPTNHFLLLLLSLFRNNKCVCLLPYTHNFNNNKKRRKPQGVAKEDLPRNWLEVVFTMLKRGTASVSSMSASSSSM
jgi:hypothetical protein